MATAEEIHPGTAAPHAHPDPPGPPGPADGGSVLPVALASFTERVLGSTTVVADLSWPYHGSEVHRVRAVDGREYIVKQLLNQRFFEREVIGYGWAPALGPDRAPTLVAADGDVLAVILTVLPGVMLKRGAGLSADDEPDAFRQAGELLARLHRAIAPQHDSSTIERLAGRTEDHLRRAAAELSPAGQDRVRACAQTLTSLAPQLISGATHGDFQRRNLLWRSEERILGAIDFERAEVAPAVRDLVLLESDVFFDRPDLRDCFMHGYGRALDPVETRALEAWIVLDAASALAWGTENRQQGLIDRARRVFAARELAERGSDTAATGPAS